MSTLGAGDGAAWALVAAPVLVLAVALAFPLVALLSIGSVVMGFPSQGYRLETSSRMLTCEPNNRKL